ncbi:MAG: hypothetical protein V2B18_23770 [Pseudomonadota bacterium]
MKSRITTLCMVVAVVLFSFAATGAVAGGPVCQPRMMPPPACPPPPPSAMPCAGCDDMNPVEGIVRSAANMITGILSIPGKVVGKMFTRGCPPPCGPPPPCPPAAYLGPQPRYQPDCSAAGCCPPPGCAPAVGYGLAPPKPYVPPSAPARKFRPFTGNDTYRDMRIPG